MADMPSFFFTKESHSMFLINWVTKLYANLLFYLLLMRYKTMYALALDSHRNEVVEEEDLLYTQYLI